MATLAEPRRFTVDEYYAMGEAGILTRDDRVELLDGVIVEMAPISSRHAATVDRFTRRMVQSVGNRAIVRVQGPLRLSQHSAPQPDVMLLRERADFYETGMPGPDDALLLIEVADSSVGYDRYEKLPAYARAGIPEVWIAVARERRRAVEVYTQPENGRYTEISRPGLDDTLTPAAFPDLELPVGPLLSAYA